MKGTLISDAHNQWANRPADERFETLAALHAHVSKRRNDSFEHGEVPISRMNAVAQDGKMYIGSSGSVSATMELNNWSMSQLCSRVGAPRDFLAKLTPEIAALALSDRMLRSADTAEQGLTFDQGMRPSLLRALNGSQYERLWDNEITGLLTKALPEGWRNPTGYGGGKFGEPLQPQGLYASDRDVWAFFISGGDANDVNWNTVDLDGEPMHRGFFVWNSEVGKTSFGWSSFWFNMVCGNHYIWGASNIETVRAVHRSSVRSAFRGFGTFMNHLQTSDTRDSFAAAVRAAKDEIAVALQGTHEDVITAAETRFRKEGFTATQVVGALDAMTLEEKSPRGSRWDWLQGFTAHARTEATAEARVALERLATKTLLTTVS